MQILKDRRRLLILAALAALILVGAAARITACWKGYPDLRGADESIVVVQAIGLLERHSFEADTYSWPAHLLVKASAAIFEVYSQLRFGQPAVEIYALNPNSFYVLARGFTALLGTLMIPLAFWICETVKRGAGLWGAALFTFFSVYIEHSGYDTPDVPMAFFTLLTVALAIRYLDKATWGRLAALCICVGAGITVKYTGALGCLLIAAVVIVQAWRDRSPRLFVLGGLFSVGLVFLAFFLLAPNLVTNAERTLWQLGIEARGEYGLLPFLTKLRDYVLTWIDAGPGLEGLVLAAVGAVWLGRRWQARYLPLFLGFVYWVALSAMGLWWVRWGTPFYTAPLLLAAVGGSACFDMARAALAGRRGPGAAGALAAGPGRSAGPGGAGRHRERRGAGMGPVRRAPEHPGLGGLVPGKRHHRGREPLQRLHRLRLLLGGGAGLLGERGGRAGHPRGQGGRPLRPDRHPV